MFLEDLVSLDDKLVSDELEASFEAFATSCIKVRLPVLHVLVNYIATVNSKIWKELVIPDLTRTEMELISHIKERALPKLEMVHSFGSLSCQDNNSEPVRERPKGEEELTVK